MDHLANKKIKISINALTGRNIMTLTDKEVRRAIRNELLGNKKYYSTDCRRQEDKYLNYITPIKPKKDTSNGKLPIAFSTMDVETIEFKGKEIPISISIKTRYTCKIFIIDFKPCFRPNVKPYFEPCLEPCYKPYFEPKFNDKQCIDIAIKDLWNKFFDFVLNNCNKEVIFVHNLGNFDGFFIYKALSNRFKPPEGEKFLVLLIQIINSYK
jgi:hypothetical protein